MNPRDGNHVKANLLTNNFKTRYINVRTGLQASLGAWYQTLEKDLLKMTANIIKVNNYNCAFRGTAIKKSIVKVWNDFDG